MVLQEEAQRLINISLGKIASYRSQRGSSNLHKNVLVANVLRRVRNTTEEEPLRQVSSVNLLQELKSDQDSVSSAEDSVNAKPNGVFGRLAIHASDVTMSRGDSDVGDFLVEGRQQENESQNRATDFNATNDTKSENKLSSLPAVRTKNLKRRQSAEAKDCANAKRRKESNLAETMRWRVTRRLSDCDSDVETESNIDLTSEEINALDCKDSPMDVEQICGLVSVFRSSFQGLGYLGNATSEQISRNTNSYPTTITEARQNTLRRGLSLPDLCGKQAVDGLSRQPFKMHTPALALTV